MANRNPAEERIFTDEGIVCAREEETRDLGRELASGITADATLSLEGPLGAGKTCFVKGLAEGLGIDPAGVSSPTFTLVHEYPGGRLPLVHFDFYRLDSEGELAGLGYEEYFLSPGVRAIENARSRHVLAKRALAAVTSSHVPMASPRSDAPSASS